MQEQNKFVFQNRIYFISIILGFLIPISALFIDHAIKDVPGSINGYLYLYKMNPLHWVFISIPVFSILVMIYMKTTLIKQQENLDKAKSDENKQREKIQELAKSLINAR